MFQEPHLEPQFRPKVLPKDQRSWNIEGRTQRADQIRVAVKHAQSEGILTGLQVQISLAGKNSPSSFRTLLEAVLP